MGMIGDFVSGAAQGAAKGYVENINDQIERLKQETILELKAQVDERYKAKDRDRIAGVMKSVPTSVPGTMDKSVVETDDNYGQSVQRVPEKKRPFDDVLKDQTTALLNSGDTASAGTTAAIYGKENEAKNNLRQAALDTRLTIAEQKLSTAEEIAKGKGDIALALGGMRQDARDNPPLTPTQKMKNKEIDIARRKIEGLSPADIKKRTQKTSDTGRDNPDYDAQLAGRVRMASRRKVGDDPFFDDLMGDQGDPATAKPAAGNASADTVFDRFGSDPAMKGMRPGRSTANGVEVFDASGKLVGHYQ